MIIGIYSIPSPKYFNAFDVKNISLRVKELKWGGGLGGYKFNEAAKLT